MSGSQVKPRGICNRCNHLRTLLSFSRGYCKPCGYEWGNCICCLAYRKIYVSGRCYGCYQDDLVRKYLDQIAADFSSPASAYNRYIFEIYLAYIRRYRMSYDHLKPSRTLASILSRKPIDPIQSWLQVYQLSAKYPLTRSPGRKVHDNGCAWSKIGYMLQELGVVAPRSEGYEHRLSELVKYMDSKTANHVHLFLNILKKSGRTDSTVLLATLFMGDRDQKLLNYFSR